MGKYRLKNQFQKGANLEKENTEARAREAGGCLQKCFHLERRDNERGLLEGLGRKRRSWFDEKGGEKSVLMGPQKGRLMGVNGLCQGHGR